MPVWLQARIPSWIDLWMSGEVGSADTSGMLFGANNSVSDPAPAMPLPADTPPWVKAILSALRKHKLADAVRMLLKLIDDGVFPRDRAWSAIQQAFDDDSAALLLQACSVFPCPMCDAGFLACTVCEGRGANEGIACRTCRTLSTVPCDFCAGSGLAGYGFFPPGLQPRVAALRVSRAITQLPQDQAVDGAPVGELLAAYRQMSRRRAVLNNALEMCSTSTVHAPEIIPHLVVQGWRGMAAVETAMAQHAIWIAAAAQASATAATSESPFHEERQHLMEEEAAQLAASAQNRTLRMRQCSRRGA